MSAWLVGCGQITWPRNVSEEQVLRDIAQAGYAGAPAFPKPATSTADRLALWQRVGLRPAPGYLGGDFWDASRYDILMTQAESSARFAQEVGLDCCYVAANVDGTKIQNGRTRMQAAGHVTEADGMSESEWTQFIRTLTDVGMLMRQYGVKAAFHNHVGSFIETRAELDRLMQSIPADVLALGPDTGHMAWAGGDVSDMVRTYASRIVTMHLKDVNADAAARARADKVDYRTAERYGVWTELGQGMIDFPHIITMLSDVQFAGWLIVETDVTQLATPLQSALQSRAYLQSLGI
jgi:inosose dehydratase